MSMVDELTITSRIGLIHYTYTGPLLLFPRFGPWVPKFGTRVPNYSPWVPRFGLQVWVGRLSFAWLEWLKVSFELKVTLKMIKKSWTSPIP